MAKGRRVRSPEPSTLTPGQPQVINLSGAQLSGDLNQQIEQAMQLAQQAMQQAQQEQGTAGSAPAAEPPAPLASVEEPQGNMVQERLAQLERLAELRDKGALTDAEFEAEKAKVLGGG